LAAAGVVQVQTVFLGGALAAFIATGIAVALRESRTRGSGSRDRGRDRSRGRPPQPAQQ
jgi:hypothetical protein